MLVMSVYLYLSIGKVNSTIVLFWWSGECDNFIERFKKHGSKLNYFSDYTG